MYAHISTETTIDVHKYMCCMYLHTHKFQNLIEIELFFFFYFLVFLSYKFLFCFLFLYVTVFFLLKSFSVSDTRFFSCFPFFTLFIISFNIFLFFCFYYLVLSPCMRIFDITVHSYEDNDNNQIYERLNQRGWILAITIIFAIFILTHSYMDVTK